LLSSWLARAWVARSVNCLAACSSQPFARSMPPMTRSMPGMAMLRARSYLSMLNPPPSSFLARCNGSCASACIFCASSTERARLSSSECALPQTATAWSNSLATALNTWEAFSCAWPTHTSGSFCLATPSTSSCNRSASSPIWRYTPAISRSVAGLPLGFGALRNASIASDRAHIPINPPAPASLRHFSRSLRFGDI
jgi:hypothetical protein